MTDQHANITPVQPPSFAGLHGMVTEALADALDQGDRVTVGRLQRILAEVENVSNKTWECFDSLLTTATQTSLLNGQMGETIQQQTTLIVEQDRALEALENGPHNTTDYVN